MPRSICGIGRGLLLTGLVGLLAGVFAERGAAQNRVPDANEGDSPRWRTSFSPYFWISGLEGRVGTGGQTSEVDLSFEDIIDQFDIGVMGLLEVRRDPWVLRSDLLYMDMSDQVESVNVGQQEFMIHPEVGYAVVRQPWGGVDAYIGVRYWHLSVNFSGSVPTVSGDKGWIDGTGGAGVRYQPSERWHLFVKGDLGAGGSDFTWQAWGGAGYDVGRCCVIDALYRYLSVDYEKDDFVYDVHMNGPALGVTLRF